MSKNVVLINLKPPYELKPSTVRLAASARCLTNTVQQVLLASDTDVLVLDLLQQEYNNNNNDNNNDNNVDDAEQDKQEPTKLPCTKATFTDIFDAAHTIILPDSMFLETSSRVFNHTAAFVQHGLPALQHFYTTQNGTVIIQCVEGALSSACMAKINTSFGTDWRIHVLADAITLGPTAAGRRVLASPHLPQQVIWKDSAFFLACPEPDEGLYKIVLPTRDEFEESFVAQDEVFERLGIEKDASMDCFDVEKSWKDYIDKYSDRYGLALHTNNDSAGGGQVIWYGDRSQTNRTMSFIFCKLLAVGGTVPENGQGAEDEDEDDNLYFFSKRKQGLLVPNSTLLMAALVVLAAILAKFWGF